MPPYPEQRCDGSQEQRLGRQSTESAGILLFTATVYIACWLLVGSIGWATSPQPLADNAATLGLIFLWLIHIATGGCLMALVAPNLAVGFTAAIIGATTVTIYRTLMASHGNGAIWSFWISAGAYTELAYEAMFVIIQMLQDRIAHRFEINASTRPV